jgi:hypothetical protein
MPVVRASSDEPTDTRRGAALHPAGCAKVEAKAVDAAVEITLRLIVPDPRPDIDLSDRPEPTSVHL